jgi:hypothetical protein
MSKYIIPMLRFLNPLNVTKVSPSDDIEGINNFDIFVIQEGAKTSGTGFIAIIEVVTEKSDADQ